MQGSSKDMGGVQTCRGHPNIWGHPNIQGVSKHGRCPNVWGQPNIQGDAQTYRGHPNIWGHPKIQGPSHKAGFATSIIQWKTSFYQFSNIGSSGLKISHKLQIATSENRNNELFLHLAALPYFFHTTLLPIQKDHR